MKRLITLCIVLCVILSGGSISVSYSEEKHSIIEEYSYYKDISEYVTFPTYTLECGDLQVTLDEICADEDVWRALITCELMREDAELRKWYQSIVYFPEDPQNDPTITDEFNAENIDKYPEKPIYFVNVMGFIQEYADLDCCEDTFNTWQVSENELQIIMSGGIRERLQIKGNDEVTFYFRIKVWTVYGGEVTEQEYVMTYDYQILPTLDYCSFQGEILYEELNYQLLGIHGKVTPLHVSMEFEHGRIEPGRQDASVDGDIYLLDYTYFREEKAYELPDKFYIVVENKQKDWIECFHLFYREGNSYNLVKSVPGPKE